MPPAKCLPNTWVYPNTSEVAVGCWRSVAVAAHWELGSCVFKLAGQPRGFPGESCWMRVSRNAALAGGSEWFPLV